MQGRNSFKLNPATVIEAVQEYMDKRQVSGKFDEIIGMDTMRDETGLWLVFQTQERPLPPTLVKPGSVEWSK